MKRIFLLVALVSASFSFAFAEGNTKAEISAAMTAGRKAMNTKIMDLQSSLKHHQTQAAAITVNDLLALMRKGVQQTHQDADLMKGADRDARFKHMESLENIVINYMDLAKDVPGNSQKLVEAAQHFVKEYK